MKINIKSKKGFTLIELLVVIGILAVLAAIAIPSIAGLIDRANVSADETNTNEMTNALERFASEYELYVQDIGSGALNPDDLDSAQGRVYNVTGATTRGDITAIEKAQSVKVADVGDEVAIYRDTKYPVNNATLHKIVENYMKTSSSTFEPKQSDCNYYYSPDCGLVVCTETDKSETADLNALVVSGKDAKGKELGAQTQWINITVTQDDNVVQTMKTFNIDGTAYNFTEGMTWGEWAVSEFNTTRHDCDVCQHRHGDIDTKNNFIGYIVMGCPEDDASYIVAWIRGPMNDGDVPSELDSVSTNEIIIEGNYTLY